MKIILALRETELSVNHLADVVDGSPHFVAHQFARLSAAGIVAAHNRGSGVDYLMATQHVADLMVIGAVQVLRVRVS